MIPPPVFTSPAAAAGVASGQNQYSGLIVWSSQSSGAYPARVKMLWDR